MPFWKRKEKDTGPRGPEDWFRGAVQFYRQLGFFEEHKDLPEADLVATLHQFMDEAYDEGPDQSRRADPEVMRLDEDRVWWDDLEADVCAENEVYTEVLPRIAAISRGALRVEDIAERWDSDSGPVTVEFTANGTKRTIHPEYQDDWIAPNFLEEVARLLEGTPYRYYSWNTQGQDLFLVVLTTEEANRIRSERGMDLEPL